jgi:uncharacterized membrane protein YcjF (UPF0283 family)
LVSQTIIMSNVVFVSDSFSDAEKTLFSSLLVAFIVIAVVASITESVLNTIRKQQQIKHKPMKMLSSAVSVESEIAPNETEDTSTQQFRHKPLKVLSSAVSLESEIASIDTAELASTQTSTAN